MVKTFEFAIHYDRDFQELCIYDCTTHMFESAGSTIDEVIDDVCRMIVKRFGNSTFVKVNEDDVADVKSVIEDLPHYIFDFEDIDFDESIYDERSFDDHYVEIGTVHITVEREGV